MVLLTHLHYCIVKVTDYSEDYILMKVGFKFDKKEEMWTY